MPIPPINGKVLEAIHIIIPKPPTVDRITSVKKYVRFWREICEDYKLYVSYNMRTSYYNQDRLEYLWGIKIRFHTRAFSGRTLYEFELTGFPNTPMTEVFHQIDIQIGKARVALTRKKRSKSAKKNTARKRNMPTSDDLFDPIGGKHER